MQIKIIADKCQQTPTEMTVVVEATNRDDAVSLQTRTNVIKYAQQLGFAAHGIAGVPNPYPVDANGLSDEDGEMGKSALALGKRPIAGYRAEFKLHASIGAR